MSKAKKFENVYAFEEFQEEFEEVVSEKKTSGRYHKWLRRSILLIKQYQRGVIALQGFEKLITKQNEPDLYAIRNAHSKKNPRVIYVYLEGNEIFLLHTFLETSKNANKEYRSAIEIAIGRLNQMV